MATAQIGDIAVQTIVEELDTAGTPQENFPNATAEAVAAADDMTFEDSVQPVLDAGQAVVVDNEFSLDDALWLKPTPGHTPGHVAVRMRSKQSNAVMSGDLIHSPLQLAYPDWSPFYDDDPALARRTRRAFLEAQCDRDIVVMTAHFPLPSMGHVVSVQDGFRFRNLPS